MTDLQFDVAGHSEIKHYFEACGFEVDPHSLSRETKGGFFIVATWVHYERFVDAYEIIIGLDSGWSFWEALEKLDALAHEFGGWVEEAVS